MKIQDLEARISDRANYVVQTKIATFKREIDDALKKLFGHTSVGGDSFGQYGFFDGLNETHFQIPRMKLEALKMAICDYTKTGKLDTKVKLPWPAALWEKERDVIRAELLSKMDLMQQLLVGKPRTSDTDVPEDTPSPG